MISANELRIGNYLLSVQTGKPVIVDWLVIKHIQDGNRQCPPYDMSLVYKPIKLTEELLLKCGFKRGSVTMYFLSIPNLACEIHATWFHNQYVIELQNHRIPIVTEVTYLHQLQNLYFALTGKELEVKL